MLLEREVAGVDELDALLGSLTGEGGPLHEIAVTRATTGSSVRFTVSGTASADGGLAAFADPDLLAAIGATPYADELDARRLTPTDALGMTLRIGLPGVIERTGGTVADDGTVTWQIPLDGSTVDLDTASVATVGAGRPVVDGGGAAARAVRRVDRADGGRGGAAFRPAAPVTEPRHTRLVGCPPWPSCVSSTGARSAAPRIRSGRASAPPARRGTRWWKTSRARTSRRSSRRSVPPRSPGRSSRSVPPRAAHGPPGCPSSIACSAPGIVPGSVTLLGGEPGIGKSTLLLQLLASWPGRTLYVSAEESAQQVRLRAERLGALRPDLWLLAETVAAAHRRGHRRGAVPRWW